MATTGNIKQERIHIRLDSASKHKLEQAARYAHKSLSEFVVGQALNAADEVILEHETITLKRADWKIFLNALDNPPRPNARLKRAFADHRRRTRS